MLHCFYSQTIIVNQYNTFRLDMNEKKMKKDVKKMSIKILLHKRGVFVQAEMSEDKAEN